MKKYCPLPESVKFAPDLQHEHDYSKFIGRFFLFRPQSVENIDSRFSLAFKVRGQLGFNNLIKSSFASRVREIVFVGASGKNIINLHGIEALKSLISINIVFGVDVLNVQSVYKNENLKALRLDVPCSDSQWSLANLPFISELAVSDERYLNGIEFQTKLYWLRLSGLGRIDFSFLRNLVRLKSLELIQTKDESWLRYLQSPSTIRYLYTYDVTSISSIINVSGLKDLKYLVIEKCEVKNSFIGLNNLRNLLYLEIRDCKGIDFSAVNLPDSLEFFYVFGEKRQISSLENLIKRHPHIKFFYIF